MTKYFTHDQFTKRFLDEFIEESYQSQNSHDRILGQIFEAHQDEVADHLKGCLAYLDIEIAQGYSGTTHELVGYNFHKGFRQHGVIDAPLLDSIVWTCIANADLFWDTMNTVAELHDKGVEKVSKPLDTVSE